MAGAENCFKSITIMSQKVNPTDSQQHFAADTMPMNQNNFPGELPDTPPAQEDSVQESDALHPSRLSFFGKLACKFVPYGEIYETLTLIKDKVRDLNTQLEAHAQEIELKQKNISDLQATEQELLSKLSIVQNTVEQKENQLAALYKSLSVNTLDEAVNALNRLTGIISEFNHLKNTSYDTLVKNDFPSLKTKYPTISEALNALAAFVEEASKPKPKQRTLNDIIINPTPEEASMIWEYVNKTISSGKPVPSTRLRESIDNAAKVPALEKEINDLKKRLADTDAIAEEVLAGKWSQPVSRIIVAKLVNDINKSIEDDTKLLAADTDLESLTESIAQSLSRPTDNDDAIAAGQRKVLKAVSDVIGNSIEAPENVAESIETWYSTRVANEILTLFSAVPESERTSPQTIAAVTNDAMNLKTEVSELLKKYDADTIGALPSAVIKAKYADLKEKYITDSKDNDIAELVKVGSLESALKRLIELIATGKKQIEQEQKLTADAQKATETARAEVENAVNSLNSLKDDILKTAADALSARNLPIDATEPVSAVKNLAKTLENIIAETDNKVNSLNNTVDDLNTSISTLNSEIDDKKADIEKFFTSYTDFIKGIFAEMNNAVRNSFTGSNRETPLPRAIDEKIINNDYMGLDEFLENLDENLAKINHDDPAALTEAIRATFIECLDISSATWIDNLARLFCYSQVPFIAEQFATKKLNITRINTAFALLQALLSNLGITLLYPELFKDTFDADKFDAEAIRNIDAYVSDIPAHVNDEDTVIDLYSLGYTLNEKLKAKPTVSRINN